jgi:hypothetical protein
MEELGKKDKHVPGDDLLGTEEIRQSQECIL